MAIRVSRQRAEVLNLQEPNVRVSRQRVEALTIQASNLRASRQFVELLVEEAPNLRASRQFVEVLGFREFNTRVSRQFVELLVNEDPTLVVSRQFTELLMVENPNLVVFRQFVEALAPVNIFRPSASSLLVLQHGIYIDMGYHITVEYYGTLQEANDYFGNRLHERVWSKSSPTNRERALWAASLIIDALNFKGDKHSESQWLEFPRDDDTEVPEEIRVTSYEIAHSLLDGKDPDLELEALGIISHSIQDTTTSYSRQQVPIEHIINGVPSEQAWRLLRPFLREDDAIVLSRIS